MEVITPVITPEPTLDKITDEKLNQTPLDFIRNLARSAKQPKVFLDNNALQKNPLNTAYCEETQKKQEKETDIRQKRYINRRINAKNFLTNIAYSRLNKEGYNIEHLSAIFKFC